MAEFADYAPGAPQEIPSEKSTPAKPITKIVPLTTSKHYQKP